MPTEQKTTGRWDPRLRRYVTETTGRDAKSTTDYQSTSGLAAASRQAREKRAEAAETTPDKETTTEDQAEALGKPRKRKAGY